jgi:hypothetical protein
MLPPQLWGLGVNPGVRLGPVACCIGDGDGPIRGGANPAGGSPVIESGRCCCIWYG